MQENVSPSPDRAAAWIVEHPKWSAGTHEGNAALLRSYSFVDAFHVGQFSSQLVSLVTEEQDRKLSYEDDGSSTLQITLVENGMVLGTTILRDAEECDDLFTLFAKEADAVTSDGEDDNWDGDPSVDGLDDD